MSARPSGRRILLAVTADASIPVVRGSAEHLAAAGWDVHVVSSGGDNGRALSDRSPVVVHDLAMRRDPAPVPDLVALLRMVRLVRRVRPDVVSAATPKAALLVGLAAWLCRVPVRVHQLWGLRYETTTGTRRRVLRWLEKASAASATDVVAVSASLRDVAVADGIASRIHVIGAGSSHGVDVERFTVTPDQRAAARAVRWPDGSDLPVVGFVGRLHPDKGLDTLVDAVRLLDRRGIRGRLLLVGGEEGASHLLDGLRDAGGWASETTGHVSDVAPYVALMDLLCLPSRREGFPNVVLEAAVAGVACVGTPATGVVDAIVDGQTGVLAADHTPEALADALEPLLRDAEGRARLGAAARERALAHFDQRDVWAAYERHYAALAGAAR